MTLPVPLRDNRRREVHDGRLREGDDGDLGTFRNGRDEMMQRLVQQSPTIVVQHRLTSIQNENVAT